MMNCKVSSYGSVDGGHSEIWRNVRAPFGSLEGRFSQKNDKSPGPANYTIDSVKATKQRATNAVIGSA